MDRDVLFLRTLDDLERRLESGRRDEYEAMQIAGLLRKLLIDGETLVAQVNRGPTRRLKIRFRTSLPASMDKLDDFPEPPPPEAPPFVRGVAEVTVDGFLSRFAAWVAPHEYTVRDLILYVANIKGAVHAGRATNDREEVLVATGNQIRVGGFDPSVYTLFSIAEVVLHGLDPIRKLVVEEMESSALDAEAEW